MYWNLLLVPFALLGLKKLGNVDLFLLVLYYSFNSNGLADEI